MTKPQVAYCIREYITTAIAFAIILIGLDAWHHGLRNAAYAGDVITVAVGSVFLASLNVYLMARRGWGPWERTYREVS